MPQPFFFVPMSFQTLTSYGTGFAHPIAVPARPRWADLTARRRPGDGRGVGVLGLDCVTTPHCAEMTWRVKAGNGDGKSCMIEVRRNAPGVIGRLTALD